MRKVWIKPYNHKKFYTRAFFTEKMLNPFYRFDKKARKHDIELKLLRKESGWKIGQPIVCADVPYPWDVDLWLKLIRNGKDNNILICFDSPLVVPFNHWKSMKNIFHKIYTYNDDLVDDKTFIKLYLPQVEPDKRPKKRLFKEKKLLVMINSKKSSFFPMRWLSPYKADYYKKRLQLIEFLDENLTDKFDLFGHNWDKPDRFSIKERIFGFNEFEVYKGSVTDKLESLSKYKFCIAFENSAVPGYITEKIFDCFWAGTVPIYLGSPNIEKYVPKECFIDFRKFGSYKEMLDYLEKMEEAEYKKYLSNIKTFIGTKQTKKLWFGDEFIDSLLKSINS